MFHLPWLLLLLAAPSYQIGSQLGQRDLPNLNPAQISALVAHPDPVRSVDPSNPDSHLSKILIPRVGWHIEEDTFVASTPQGDKRFTNVIATHDPDAPRRVILSAHFDSKWFASHPQDQFVGATDSAAPCAMMLDLAEALTPLLNTRSQHLQNKDEDDIEEAEETTLQLVFFDGEEAFGVWTDTDSIYGAKNLAQKWHSTYLPPPPPHSKRRLLPPGGLTELDTVEHLILLDLLGSPKPHIRSFFPDTAWLFDALVSAESRLFQSGAFSYPEGTSLTTIESFFIPRTGKEISAGYIGDDHLPFMHRGVNVLHLIPEPFPRVWHTLGDDATALDVPTMRRWNLILRVFFSEYLHLQPEVTATKEKREQVVSKTQGELAEDG
ncbi:hypothetical protein HWV62_39637 [Athelia sp. TMB]|nr:hypothetical protein HWV62_39637 [Athelia sp. TMB]